jgi:hypothetical protein
MRALSKPVLLLALLLGLGAHHAAAADASAPDPLTAGFKSPPNEARLRAYWWWLNGNVTRQSITRDLEQMKAKGFGGALICDANGSSQDGNDPAPHGPTFFSPEWRALYKHCLQEADRLGLEMSLNIQSGWNLGGPMVKASDAAKKLVWTETTVRGPGPTNVTLAEPKHALEYYEDLFVVAFPAPNAATQIPFKSLTARSAQPDHPAGLAGDGEIATFWVSAATTPGQGPARERPEWLQVDFATEVEFDQVTLQGREGYGPKAGEVQAALANGTYERVAAFAVPDGKAAAIPFKAVRSRSFRVVFFDAYDPRSPGSPRNVQVTELRLSGPAGSWPPTAREARLQGWEAKAVHKTLHFSAPDTTPLFQELPEQPGEPVIATNAVTDLTRRLDGQGRLQWAVPPGTWTILRIGSTVGNHSKVSTSSDGWQGYALDVLDTKALKTYWDSVVEPLILDAGPLAGKALKYLHTDSWEVEAVNWTPTLRAEFSQRRGYDFLPWLPALTGRVVASRPLSNRFLNDYRKTLGDLAVDNHFLPFKQWAHQHGLEIHPESGGPHAVPIDAQRCLGQNDVPMSEFWAWSWRHRVGDSNRFFVKQPASAAHTYGRRFVAAEGFTTIGPHWQETLWDNLKPSFDYAICEGLNRLVWHAFVCSPAEMGLPGQEYFAGTHFNPNSTWWEKSGPFLAYLNRCQFLAQQGLFVADAAYYYGDHVPNFAQLKRTDPAQVLPGYDYDVVTEEVLLTRMSVQNGRLVLPDGMSYRVLVLPDRPGLSLPVLRKIRALAQAGGTIIGPRPTHPLSLQDHPRSDTELTVLVGELWGAKSTGIRSVGQGRIITGQTARQVLMADGIGPDFSFVGRQANTVLNYIHRRQDGTEIYFVVNSSNRADAAECTFRVTGKQPELWDPLTGEIRPLPVFRPGAGVTTLPLEFTPYGSWFVVFRQPGRPATPGANFPAWQPVGELGGAWQVQFDPLWGGPAQPVRFDRLTSWTVHPEAGVKYFSGTATYRQMFDLPAGVPAGQPLWLDLGDVRQLAEVRLNGRSLGITWSRPFRVALGDAVKPAGNTLEIEVVNFWPNRVIGDQSLPPEKRYTRTNIRKFTKDSPLVESGLLGPVQLLRQP